MKRIFLIVLDGFGIGAAPDADEFTDSISCNTLSSISKSVSFSAPNLQSLGLFNIDDINTNIKPTVSPIGSFAKLQEKSKSKDTVAGHWEICGLISTKAFPTYPHGFPNSIISQIELQTKRKVICNKPYSGTKLLADYGKEQQETGNLLIYTSADSVLQVAAHEKSISINQLYNYCNIIRQIMCGEHAVGRIIARPFAGKYPNYVRTSKRKDFSLAPPQKTLLDVLKENGKEVIAIGKISDIFAGCGCTKSIKTKNNSDGLLQLSIVASKNFEGLCFLNLIDFDMLYGHRRNVDGYANEIKIFDSFIGNFIHELKKEDILIITADHGCDPGYSEHTDHTREYVPMIIFGEKIRSGVNLKIRETFADISATVLDYFLIPNLLAGKTFLNMLSK